MTESMRRRFERNEDERLAPYALRSATARRRFPIENEGRLFDYRTQFQRDRDRIVYSRAFRRLRQKAQSGRLPDYEDHRRNRLTHTLEVTQLARTIGRALDLNEDLIEAIALGHDLGQPAFGPAGERALADLLDGRLDGRGGPGLGPQGGFRRASQSLRVVDRIEKRYDDHPGLNLTDEVREGIFKSDGESRGPADGPEGVRQGLAPSFEAQVVVLADRIAGPLQELDDALQSGVVEIAAVERRAAVRQLRRKIGARYGSGGGPFMKANAIHRGLSHLLVTSAVLASRRALTRWAASHNVVEPGQLLAIRDDAVAGDEVALPAGARKMLDDLERFLDARVRRGRQADRVESEGRRIVLGLCAAYLADPTQLDDHVLFRFREIAGVRFLRDLPRSAVDDEVERRYRTDPRFLRIVVDHLAAMTDAYAAGEHRRLMTSGAVPIPSAEQLRREGRDD